MNLKILKARIERLCDVNDKRIDKGGINTCYFEGKAFVYSEVLLLLKPKKVVVRVTKRFKELAELLVQIMVESYDTTTHALAEAGKIDVRRLEESRAIINKFNPKIPERIIRRTAISLQKAFKDGDLKEDEDGRLYYTGMIDDFGGWIDRDLLRQARKLKT